MGWEWVPPVATATTAIAIGVTGIVATYLTGKRSREVTAALAREDREQKRRAEAYVELLTVVGQIAAWAAATNPMFDEGGEVPDLPSVEAQMRADALVTAYGSAEVVALNRDWQGSVARIRAGWWGISYQRNSPRADRLKHDPWLKQEQEYRPAERQSREALAAQIRKELAGEEA